MSKRGKRYALFSVLCAVAVSGAAAILVTVLGPVGETVQLAEDQYRAELESLPYAEQLDFAAGTLLAGSDEGVALRALRDLVETSKELDRTADALAKVEQYLGAVPESSQRYQDAFYTRARLIHRFDKASAETLFRQGIANGWKVRDRGTPFDAYKDSLWHNDPAGYVVECFNHAMLDGTGQFYLAQGDYLTLMGVDLIWPQRKKGLALSATAEIAPRLVATPSIPHHRQIAEAVCFVLDERYEEAASLFLNLDASLLNPPLQFDPNDPAQALAWNEKLNLPLYVAAVLAFEGKDRENTRLWVEEFLRRNSGRPHYASQRLMRIVYALERAAKTEQRRMTWITNSMVAAGLGVNEQLPRQHRLHILDMHIVGLLFRRDFSGALPYCEALVADYDPREEALNSSLFALGCIDRHNKDYAQAQESFSALMNAHPSGRWRRAAAAQLAEVRMDLGRPLEEVEPLLAVFDVYGSPAEAEFFRYESTLARSVGYAPPEEY